MPLSYYFRSLAFAFTVALLLVRPLGAEPVQADILLKGGTIHDGSGGEPVVGDVAIRDGRIVAVGTFEVAMADQVKEMHDGSLIDHVVQKGRFRG